MNSANQLSINNRQSISREKFLWILSAAIDARSYRFARQAALTWLTTYSGDLEVKLKLSQAVFGEGRYTQAITDVKKICATDPEFKDAWKILAQMTKQQDQSSYLQALANLQALGDEKFMGVAAQDWGMRLAGIQKLMEDGTIDEAEQQLYEVLGKNPNAVLPAVVHLKLALLRQEYKTVHNLSNIYHDRFPECLQIVLALAESKLNLGDDTGALNLLHECLARDAAGQVPSRWWGNDFRYRPLWPDTLAIKFDMPVPTDVAAVLGWNILPQGAENAQASEMQTEETNLMTAPNLLEDEPSQTDPAPEIEADQNLVHEASDTSELGNKNKKFLKQNDSSNEKSLESIEKEFAKLAKKLNKSAIAHSDNRFPIYVVFSSQKGLEKKYGKQTTSVIIQEMNVLSEEIKKHPGWGSIVFCPDDVISTADLNISRVDVVDPWKLKLALMDLDQVLSKKGSMIGSLLIVGGHDVVPFHKLPNPTDDLDQEVLSDNPYGTQDGNYFVTEWPVGRLPGESGNDAGLLLSQLRNVIEYHKNQNQNQTERKNLMSPLTWFKLLRSLFKNVLINTGSSNFGLSASVWRNSSLAAFQPIGNGDEMLISPPEISGSFEEKRITEAPLGYYNLHGLVDSSDWYGQKDPSDNYPGPDYPVALSPKNLKRNGKAPKVVYSEACYGGHIFNKTEDQSLALKFISLGSLAFVGSTCVAYGSVNEPLVGADLQGSLFWQYIREGKPAGEALMRARIELVSRMESRQGFLDGEDQKTLISFVLFGDPLAVFNGMQGPSKKGFRLKKSMDIKTVCDRMDSDDCQPRRISSEMLLEVKHLVEPYLPGLDDAEIFVSQHNNPAYSNKDFENWIHNPKEKQVATKNRTLVTVSKQVQASRYVHQHYARITLDDEGKVLKLAISR